VSASANPQTADEGQGNLSEKQRAASLDRPHWRQMSESMVDASGILLESLATSSAVWGLPKALHAPSQNLEDARAPSSRLRHQADGSIDIDQGRVKPDRALIERDQGADRYKGSLWKAHGNESRRPRIGPCVFHVKSLQEIARRGVAFHFHGCSGHALRALR